MQELTFYGIICEARVPDPGARGFPIHPARPNKEGSD